MQPLSCNHIGNPSDAQIFVKEDQIVEKHLPGCSGPGASSADCGFPQKQAAAISSENQKVQLSLTTGDEILSI